MKKSTRKLCLEDNDKLTILFRDNPHHKIFEEIEKRFDLTIGINKVGILVLKGNKQTSEKIFNILSVLNRFPNDLKIQDVKDYIIDGKEVVGLKENVDKYDWLNMEFRDSKGKTFNFKPKTQNQKDFIEKIIEKKVVFGIGSAGTGKSFVSIAIALKMLEKKMISKIILSRPTVEAGKSIGFLPGSVDEKLEIYMLPLMSILSEIIGKEKRDKLIADGSIEVMGIGFARGMTIGSREGVVAIFDEAQNMDFLEYKLILTRLGSHINSKIILCGDQRQSDIKNGKDNLSLVYNLIKKSKFVDGTIFDKNDIVRSEAVKEILGLIEDYEDDKK